MTKPLPVLLAARPSRLRGLMSQSGTVAALVKKYEEYEGTMLLPAPPFIATEEKK